MAKLYRITLGLEYREDTPSTKFEEDVLKALEELESYARKRGVEVEGRFYVGANSSEILITHTPDFFVLHRFLRLLYPLLKPQFYPPDKDYPEPSPGQIEFDHYAILNDSGEVKKAWWVVRF